MFEDFKMVETKYDAAYTFHTERAALCTSALNLVLYAARPAQLPEGVLSCPGPQFGLLQSVTEH